MRRTPPTAIAITALALVGTVAALAGCAAEEPAAEPAPTVTVTETATATAEPTTAERDPSAALTGLDAWSVCVGAAQGLYGISGDVAGTVFLPYDEQVITDHGDGSFQVDVPFQPADAEAGAVGECTVSGTVAEPIVSEFSVYDLG
jgi:hypothetical protein